MARCVWDRHGNSDATRRLSSVAVQVASAAVAGWLLVRVSAGRQLNRCPGVRGSRSWSFGDRNFQRWYQSQCCSLIAGHSVSAVTHNVEQSKIYPDRNLAAQYMQQKGSETTKEGAYQKPDDIAAGRCHSGGGPIVVLTTERTTQSLQDPKVV